MTMSTESPLSEEETVGAGIINGDGSAERIAARTDGDSQVATSSRDQSEGGSYDERLRAGGDFAEQEVKNWERKFGKSNSERDELKKQLDSVQSLLPVLDQLGGAQGVIQNLERFGRLMGDEKFRSVIEGYEQNGTLSVGSEDDGEYVDPLEAELRKELHGLKGEIASLKGSTLRQDGALAKQRLQEHFQKSIKAYPFTQEELSKIQGGIEANIEQWSHTEQGIQSLNALDEKSVDRLVRTQLDPDDWIAVVRRMDQSRAEEKGRLATDGVALTATEKAKTVAKTPLEACREAFKSEGLDPRDRLL